MGRSDALHVVSWASGGCTSCCFLTRIAENCHELSFERCYVLTKKWVGLGFNFLVTAFFEYAEKIMWIEDACFGNFLYFCNDIRIDQTAKRTKIVLHFSTFLGAMI